MTDCSKFLKEIKSEKRRGSTYILTLVKKLIECLISENLYNDELLRSYTLEVLRTHPSMAPLLNFFNKMWLHIESGKSLLNFVDQFGREDAEYESLMVLASSSLSSYDNFATISYSETIVDVLTRLGHIKSIRVTAALSPPAEEGKLLYSKLRSQGIDIILTRDHAVSFLLDETDVVIVGADAVFEESFINKTGTFALLLAAKYLNKPTFLITHSSKIISKELQKFIKLKVEESVTDGVIIKDPIFEEVPLDLVDYLLTEIGKMNRESIRNYLKGFKLSEFFKILKTEEIYGHG